MPNKSPRPADLLCETLPTTKHATAFFDRIAARLGERALVQRANGGKNRVLFARAGRDGPFLVPWPLVSLSIADLPEGGAPDEEAEPVAPTWTPGEPIDLLAGGIHPVPATVKIHDGASSLGVEYRWNGRWRYGTDPGERDAFADLIPALAVSTANRLELLVDYVLSMDVGRHGPARVLLPRPTPGGVEGAWVVGRGAIREAMAARRSPAGSFWAVTDGYVGTALAFGTSRDQAVATWRTEVEKIRPRPPDPGKRDGAKPDSQPAEWSPDAPPEGVLLVGQDWDAPPFDPSPAAVPAAVVRVAALPSAKPARGTWTRRLGDRGATHFAIRLPIDGGYTLVGESLLAHFDLETIDATLDDLDAASTLLSRHDGFSDSANPRTHVTTYYRCIDLATGLPTEPRLEESLQGPAFEVRGFDGGRLRDYVVRMREFP